VFIGAIILVGCNRTGPAKVNNTPIASIGPTGDVQQLFDSFQFTEGPAADDRGNLFFTDVRASVIYKIDAAGTLSKFRDPSGVANGLMFDRRSNELIVCESDGQIVALSADGLQRRVIAQQFEGNRFNAPNDLVLDAAGGIYFTDPQFNAPTPLPQGREAVYYVSRSGDVSRIIDDLEKPNGVLIAPDEQTLYVVASAQNDVLAFPIESPGKLGPKRVFCQLQVFPGTDQSAGDGLTVDTSGNVYIATGIGIQVFDSAGKPLGVIRLAGQPANCTFGGPENKTLYVTCRQALFAVPMEAQGHVFAK